jgi:hypothetical protein
VVGGWWLVVGGWWIVDSGYLFVSPSLPLPFDRDMSDLHHSIDGFRSLVITSVITEGRGSIYYIDNGNRD